MSKVTNFQPFIKKCPDCNETKNIVEDYKNGYNVCGNCGCVLKDKIIDYGTEWRNFSDSNKPDRSRVGATENPFLENSELDTMIQAGTGNASHSLNKMQIKSYVRSSGRSLKAGLNLINVYCEQNLLSKTVLDRSHYIFKIVDEKKLVKGKSIEAVVSACIYIACKQESCPRTFKEISVITAIPKREIGKCYKMISREVNGAGMFSISEIIPRFCSELNLNGVINVAAVEIAKKVMDIGCLTGRSPDSIAGAIIFLTLFLFPERILIQQNIHVIANVTDSTIKNTYKDLLPYLKDILPEGKSIESFKRIK